MSKEPAAVLGGMERGGDACNHRSCGRERWGVAGTKGYESRSRGIERERGGGKGYNCPFTLDMLPSLAILIIV